MHIITPYNPWAPKKKKTWQEELWEQQQIAEIEAQMIAEANSRTLPQNAPNTSVATAGPAVNAAAGGGGAPAPAYFNPQVLGAISITGTPTSGIAPYNVQFSVNRPAYAIKSSLWTFGDGTTSTEYAPLHTYQSSSTARTASLAVTYSNGTNELTVRNGYITATAPTVTAAFTLATSSNAAPSTGSFTNTSTYNGSGTLTYLWIYGSGSLSSSAATPTPIIYRNAGPYTASLAITESIYNITSFVTRSWRLS